MPVAIDQNRVAIYIRWSTDDQSEGTTLETQREACVYYAKSQGWSVPPERMYIDDGYSGATLDRPAMERLRAAINSGDIQCVVVNTIDRLSRNIVDAVNLVLREWDSVCHLKCVRQAIDTTEESGRMFFGILAMFADFERSQIRARTFGGRVKRASQGRNPGFNAAYGYRIGSEKGRFSIHPEESGIVTRIFEMYASGLSGRKIVSALNSEGVPAAKGGQWTVTAVLKVISNEIYIGNIRFGVTKKVRKKRDGADKVVRVNRDEPLAESHNPDLQIVPTALFQRCQEVRQQTKQLMETTSGRGVSSPHLLVGLARCKCGSTLGIRYEKSRHVRSYVCSGRVQKGTEYCDAGSISARQLEAFVHQRVEQLRSDEMLAKMVDLQKRGQAERLRQQKQAADYWTERLKNLDQELQRVRQDYRAGKLSVDDYNINRQEIEDDRAVATKNLSAAREHMQALQADEKDAAAAEQRLVALKQWPSLTTQQQKHLLRYLVESLTVYRKAGTRDDVQVNLAFGGLTADLGG